MKDTSFIMILIILVLGVLMNAPLGSSTQGNIYCSYSIEIETTCAASAGTIDAVDVRFGDSAGNQVIVKHLKNPMKVGDNSAISHVYKGFERCGIQVFEASGGCMSGTVCSLYVKQIGSDPWRPGWVKVLHHGNNGALAQVSDVFYYRTFVPQNVWFGFDYCSSKGGTLPREIASEIEKQT